MKKTIEICARHRSDLGGNEQLQVSFDIGGTWYEITKTKIFGLVKSSMVYSENYDFEQDLDIFYSLSEEELFQKSLVLDITGLDIDLLVAIQKKYIPGTDMHIDILPIFYETFEY